MTKHERHSEPSPGPDLIPESVVRRVTDERRAESELALVTSQLSEMPELRQDPAAKVDEHINDLIKRRAKLIERVRPVSTVRDLRARPVDSLVTNLGPFFSPWVVVNLPYFSEGIDETPYVDGTSGSFVTDSLSPPGGVEFGGNPQDTGIVNPYIEKWWIHNWTCSYVFPFAPSTGTLYYRFTMETSWEVVVALALSGLVNAFVTVGLTSDVRADNPFDSGAEKETAWPFWFTLPQANSNLYVNQPLIQFSGSIEVQAGRTAAIGLICGIDAGIASGYVEMLGGLMRTRLVAEPGPAMTPAILDQIEYRFEPNWWVQAVGQRLNEAATSRSG